LQLKIYGEYQVYAFELIYPIGQEISDISGPNQLLD